MSRELKAIKSLLEKTAFNLFEAPETPEINSLKAEINKNFEKYGLFGELIDKRNVNKSKEKNK